MIVGHSFGGAFTQLLLDRGPGAAGVGVASATVKGVRDLPLSTKVSGVPDIPGAPGWEEVADFGLAWAEGHALAGRGRETPEGVS